MIVLDASVAVKWLLEEPRHLEARAILLSGEDHMGPSIIIPEVCNVLRKKVKRQEIGWDQAAFGVDQVTGTLKHLIDVSPWGDRIVELSRRLDHAAYDCCYLICAEQARSPFVTDDKVLAAKGRSLGLRCYELSDWRTAVRH